MFFSKDIYYFLLLSHQGIFTPEEERIFDGMQAGEHMEGMCSEVSAGLDYYMRWCLYGIGKMWNNFPAYKSGIHAGSEPWEKTPVK